MLGSRKDIPIAPSTKMKQLQWDKVPQQLVARTVWNDESVEKEKEWVQKLQVDGVWQEMEEDFKAKQFVTNLLGACDWESSMFVFLTITPAKQKKAELKSVLDPQTKKRVGEEQRVPTFSTLAHII